MTSKKILFSKPSWPSDDKFWIFWNKTNQILKTQFSEYKLDYSAIAPGLSGNLTTKRLVPIKSKEYDLFIACHIQSAYPKCLDYKMAYLPSLFYLGNDGYAGFSNLVNKDLADKSTPQDVCNEFYSKRILPVAHSTKYAHKNATPIEKNIPQRFIFIPMQVQNDTVMTLAKTTTEEMIIRATSAAKWLNLPVVIKFHPFGKRHCKVQQRVDAFIQQNRGFVFKSVGDVRQLLNRSIATFVINSGVGFESLLTLDKPTFTFGTSDYAQATYFNYETNDIVKAINAGIDKDHITRVLYNWWQYIIDMNDPLHTSKIEAKIRQALNK